MKVIMLGDVVGSRGCDFVRRRLPALRKLCGADLVVANGENAADGNGILPASAESLFASGVDVITLGNHGLRRREITDYIEEQEALVRPVNLHPSAPGRGVYVYDRPGLPRTAVVSLLGTCYMDWQRSPFDCMDALLEELDCPVVLVDFHAEATSEKLSMAFYLDGRVSAVAGTHTHVQTADERILPGGTGYITDLGMCASFNSVLGVRPHLAIRRLRTALPTRFDNDDGAVRMSGALFDIDEKSGKTRSVERINIE